MSLPNSIWGPWGKKGEAFHPEGSRNNDSTSLVGPFGELNQPRWEGALRAGPGLQKVLPSAGPMRLAPWCCGAEWVSRAVAHLPWALLLCSAQVPAPQPLWKEPSNLWPSQSHSTPSWVSEPVHVRLLCVHDDDDCSSRCHHCHHSECTL